MECGGEKLAIIINCYNYEDYVRHSIESVLSQDTSQCDVIVVDDGSTDRSWEVIQKFNVRAFRKQNGGQVSACRYGASKTSAPFILFLDADDELVPGSIQTIIRHLDANVAKIQFPLLRIDATGTELGSTFPKLADARDRASFAESVEKAGTYISPPTSGNVFHRDLCALLETAHYDSAVDGVMLLAAPFYGDIISLAEPLGRYRVHGKNKSGTDRLPTPSLLRRHQKRFADRVSHLKEALSDQGVSRAIGNPTDMYVYLRYSNYCDILDLKRIRWASIHRTVNAFPGWYGPARRVSVVLFLLASIVLPVRTVRSILEVRLTRNWRPMLTKIRTLGMARSS